MESFATPYPVFFQAEDGSEPRACGAVGVHSALSFARFQALVAQRTGRPAEQLSSVFVCQKRVGDVDKQQKLPVSEATRFSIYISQHPPSRERDAHFLVSLKKSKKDRKVGARKRTDAGDEEEEEEEESAPPPSPEKSAAGKAGSGASSAPPVSSAAQTSAGLAAQREAAQRERERLSVIGRVAPTTATVGAPSESRPGVAAKAAPAQAPPQVLSASFAAASRSVPAPLQPAAPGSITQRPMPPPAYAAPPVAAAPSPARVAAPAAPHGSLARPGAAAPPLSGPTPAARPFGQAAARPGSGAGVEDGVDLAAPLSARGGTALGTACKFCQFCRERGHEPPFHWCPDDARIPVPLRVVPFGGPPIRA